jgi:hypothetical protein
MIARIDCLKFRQQLLTHLWNLVDPVKCRSIRLLERSPALNRIVKIRFMPARKTLITKNQEIRESIRQRLPNQEKRP